MTTWAELLEAIRTEAPDDDSATLVAADWLTDRGDRRGEYIALACELARTPERDPRRVTLRSRMDRIDDSPWTAPLEKLDVHEPWHWDRGLLRQAWLVGAAVGNVGRLLQREPVRDLTLESGGRRPSEIAAAAPELASIRALTLRGRHPLGHEIVLGSPHLVGVETLDVWTNVKIRAAFKTIACRPVAARLAIDDACMASYPPTFFERLARLDITTRELSDTGIEAMAEGPLDALAELSLRGTGVTSRGLAILGPRLAQLRALDLGGCRLDLSAVELLAHHATQLERLNLGNIADDKLVDGILDSPAADRLRRLGLVYASYSRAALIRWIQRSPHLEQRHDLDLARASNDELSAAYPGLDLTPDEDW